MSNAVMPRADHGSMSKTYMENNTDIHCGLTNVLDQPTVAVF